MAVDLGSTFKELIDEINSKSAIDSIDGLKGGTLSSPLTFTGGDGASAKKAILDNTNNGQITDKSTSTLLGFIGSDFVVGSNSYLTKIRGNANSIIGDKKFSDLATKGDLSDIKAAVAGKARSYILSYSDTFTNGRTGAKWYDKDGNDITSSIGSGNYVDSNCKNSSFNQSTDVISGALDTLYIIVRTFSDSAYVYTDYDYTVFSIATNGGLNIGDNIYVIETAVPDRWYAGNRLFYALEGKPLADYATKNGYNLFTNINTFSQQTNFYLGAVATNGLMLTDNATYKYDRITRTSPTKIYDLLLPANGGTFATEEYVAEQIGNIDTLLTALNSGTGV